GHVPFKTGSEVTARRMRGDDRSLRNSYDIIKRAVGYMRNIHHDSDPVHFAYHLLAKGAEAIPGGGGIVRRIAYLVVLAMREGDVSDAAIVEIPKVCQVVADGRPVFHAHGEGYFAFARIAFYVGRRSCEGKFVRDRL